MTTAATDPAVVPVPQTPAADPPKHIAAAELPPDALKTRLAEAKAAGERDLLAALGVTSKDDLAKAVADAKALAEAKKTDVERLTAREVELAKANAALTEYEAAIGSVWTEESAKLTAEQVAAIDAVAGADAKAAAKVRVLNALKKTWAAPAPAPPTAAPAATPPPAPASTTAATPAPAPAGTTSPTDHKAEYERLQKTNPVRAASYMAKHARDIYPE